MKLYIKIISFVILTLGINRFCWSQELENGSEFHEFITEFSQGETNQTDNITFPLLFISDNDTTYIQIKNWKKLDYCFGCEFSTLLFMDDSINYNSEFYNINENNNYVISIYLKPEKKIQNLYFTKIKNSWFLNKIIVRSIMYRDSESFFEFINEFATDTNFIKSRITSGAKYITWEDNPNELIEAPFDINEFEGDEYLFKRIYISTFDLKSDNAIFYIKGERTGYHLEYYFKKIDKKWYLTKLVNIGV